MANWKFGRKQLGKPIPANIGNMISYGSGVAGVIQVWLGTAGYIPSRTSEILQSVLGLVVAIGNFSRPYFGTEIVEEVVPAKNVTEIETKPEE